MKKYKRPKIKTKKIKLTLFMRRGLLNGLEDVLYLACGPREQYCEDGVGT